MCEILEDSFSIHHSTGQEDTDRGLRVLKFTLPIEESVLKIEIKGYEKPFSYSADTKSCSYLLIKGLNVVLEDNAQKLIKGTIDYNNNINNTIKFLPAAVDSIKFARFTDRRFKKMPTISPVANMALRHEDDQVKKTDNTSGASHPKAAIDIYSKNSTLTDDDRFDWLLRPEGLRETLKNGEVKSCHITKQKKFEIDPVLNKYKLNIDAIHFPFTNPSSSLIVHCPFRATPACKIGWILDHYYAHLDAFQGRSFRIIGKIENHIPQDYQDFIDKDSKSIRFLLIITGQDGRSIPVLFFGEDAENFLGLTLEHILNNPNSIGERMSYLVDCGKDYNSLYIDLMIFGFHPESREHQNLNVWKGFGSEINFIK
ncbi:hypothetical protein NADFUDRAFT_42637 [Nadsonia fulvescens var. elongata DSM 6958]|uniref:Uncharacterized protein n=1 Tax=Nadsonia fulvescens var. elongata DSM 6958 TaxID=857566 RepID=A0A1E3PKH9_9ASCO|nr:hypothetical protein NADFUDRAFT_42637 [Nadsonia fulvescens var. elongata DSM 6958]